MKSAYVAGPYSGETKLEIAMNVERAAEQAAHLKKLGWAVFCPHLQSHYIDELLNDDKVLTYEDYLIEDLYWLKKCDAVFFLPGWENSYGAKLEHLTAKSEGKEIYYVD